MLRTFWAVTFDGSHPFWAVTFDGSHPFWAVTFDGSHPRRLRGFTAECWVCAGATRSRLRQRKQRRGRRRGS